MFVANSNSVRSSSCLTIRRRRYLGWDALISVMKICKRLESGLSKDGIFVYTQKASVNDKAWIWVPPFFYKCALPYLCQFHSCLQHRILAAKTRNQSCFLTKSIARIRYLQKEQWVRFCSSVIEAFYHQKTVTYPIDMPPYYLVVRMSP